ncbi:MAG: hypothetical protein R2795_25115 [Saprospiraceae bacterium]
METFTIIDLKGQEIEEDLVRKGVVLKTLKYAIVPSRFNEEISGILDCLELNSDSVFPDLGRLYVNLCIALDFFIQEGVTVINLSLIIKSKDPSNLVEKLIRIALKNKICIVCAIGNKGKKKIRLMNCLEYRK